MGRNYNAQPMVGGLTPTITVADLMLALAELPPRLPVVFQTPEYGAFGSNHRYAIDGATVVELQAGEQHYPASTYIDDETGKEVQVEAWTDRWPAWIGVVIA